MNSEVSKGRERHRYTVEFKDDAVKIVIELDKPIVQVARDLGMAGMK